MTATTTARRINQTADVFKPPTPAQTAEWLAEDARAFRELEWPLREAMQFSKLAFEHMNSDDGDMLHFLTTKAFKSMEELYQLYHEGT
jgi:hypothetical protein